MFKYCSRTFADGLALRILLAWNVVIGQATAQSVNWRPGVEKVMNSIVAVQFKSEKPSTTTDPSQLRWLFYGQSTNPLDPSQRDLIRSLSFPGVETSMANPLANSPAETSSIVRACGVIIEKNGRVLATLGERPQGEMSITLADSTTHSAKLLSYDEVTGCAILQIDSKELNPVKWSEESIALGQPVAGVWTRGGQRATVVGQGIVSSSLTLLSTEETPVVETDVRIRKGAIGGALINAQGECVGILRAMTNGSAEEGHAYAIPLSILKPLLERTSDTQAIIQTGRLGITFNDESNRVSVVHEKTPAAEVGIQAGDRIISVASESVNTAEEAKLALRAFRAGDKMEIKWMRGNVRHREFVVLQGAEAKKNIASETEPDATKVNKQEGSNSNDESHNEDIRQRALLDYLNRVQPRDLAPVLQVERTDLESSIQTLVKEMAALREELRTMRESKK